jgi:bifunctional ADP-heptose synthase (sugar kinase/adenylyltransferase)
VDDRKVLKVDEGRHGPPSSLGADAIVAALDRLLPEHDALVVTDFGYGLFSAAVAEGAVAAAKRHQRPYYADVSTSGQANVLKFQGPRLATPTEAEIRWAFADNESGLAPLATRYYHATGAERLVITLGKRGAILFDAPRDGDDRLHTEYLPAMGTDPVDAVGAGDVFLATMALCDLAGVVPAAALFLASAVAAIHVGRLGNDPVDAMDIRRYLAARPELAQPG